MIPVAVAVGASAAAAGVGFGIVGGVLLGRRAKARGALNRQIEQRENTLRELGVGLSGLGTVSVYGRF